MIEISGGGVAAGQGVGFPGKYLSVTSFRRDGTPVATPVWFVEEEGRLLVETDADSYKVRRIRPYPAVLVTPCSATGRLRGKQRKAHAEILGTDALAPVRELMARKYRWDRVFILPIYGRSSARGASRPAAARLSSWRSRRRGERRLATLQR
jgi:PPOX class probable F420-dependent enzyme